MNEPRSQQEPSMEEILASIRRIISEDGVDEGAAKQPDERSEEPPDGVEDEPFGGRGRADPAPANDPWADDAAAEASTYAEEADDTDILELTDIVDDDEPEPPMSRKANEGRHVAQPSPDAEVREAPARRGGRDDDGDRDRIVSPVAAAAASDAFARLLERPDAGSEIGAVPVGDGKTVEDIVRELLRPMLREWLDANLPHLVEKLVQREVEAIARGSGKR
jgi:cell pole-organizing protein PopZ